MALGILCAEPAVTEALRAGDGLGWHQHDDDVFAGRERYFRIPVNIVYQARP